MGLVYEQQCCIFNLIWRWINQKKKKINPNFGWNIYYIFSPWAYSLNIFLSELFLLQKSEKGFWRQLFEVSAFVAANNTGSIILDGIKGCRQLHTAHELHDQHQYFSGWHCPWLTLPLVKIQSSSCNLKRGCFPLALLAALSPTAAC